MTSAQTDTTNMKDWQESGWRIWALNVPVLVVDPPAPCTDLQEVALEDFMLSAGLALPGTSRRRTIDPMTHRALLDQSLRDYQHIWKKLAEK